jgi:ubiquinol-cytochrome c reductase cytochrome c1 subunit
MKLSTLIKPLSSLAAALLLAAGLAGLPAQANEGGPVDHANINPGDQASLQRGARNFVNYCLNCHSAAYMRYSRLTDLGLTEDEIKQNLIFTGQKVGDTMTVALDRNDAKAWFGVQPPDLSVEARVRGADWLYTYLRGFYQDESRATGWNNIAFPNVGMPHVLYELQGIQKLEEEKPAGGAGAEAAGEAQHKLVLVKPGQMTTEEYDRFTLDLVNYMVYMAEPARATRIQIGVMTIFFLVLAFFLTLALKKEYWKDIH